MNQSDSGFTLAEALMALLIISLAMAGAMQAARMVGAWQKRAATDKAAETARLAFIHDLDTRLLPLQPIEGDDLEGDAHRLNFACAPDAKTRDCLLDVPAGSLTYASRGESYPAWPPALRPDDTRAPHLDAIIWRGPRGDILATLRLPVEQPRDCLFDMISRTCLEPDHPASTAAS